MNLLDYKYCKYSNIGNDGIIEMIFKIINIKNGSFVEFGAWDGEYLSNCRNLFEQGWGGTFIESDSTKFKDLLQRYEHSKNIKCLNLFIDTQKNSYDNTIKKEVDFCSIDIDGLDVSIFESINTYLPKVICMEGGQMLEPFHDRVEDNIAMKNIQQSLSVINKICEKKGYKIICSHQDTFMVRNDYAFLFDVETDLYNLYIDGVKSIPRRLPWIQNTLKSAGITNPIIDKILNDCYYNYYGYANRKEWAIQQKSSIDEYCDKLKNEHKY